MKKIKKLLAMIMAMTMVLGMSLTSFAAKEGASLTVKGLSTANTQKVDIYEIYRLNDTDNDWVKASWAAGVNIDIEAISASGVWNEAILTALKTAALATNPTFTRETVDGASSVEFTNLQAGAYLVLVTDEASKVQYNTMVAVTYAYDAGEDEDGDDVESNLIYAKDAEVDAKASSWSTEKEQAGDDVVEVGDLITYTITTTVPYTSATAPIDNFWVEDTITNATYYFTGEDVKGVPAKWQVFVGTENMTGTFGAPAVQTNGNQQSFRLDLITLVDGNNTHAGEEVVITYTAKVGAVDEITNKASSSHDKNTGIGEGETKAYTGNMQITKYGEDPDADGPKHGPTLSGAQFVIYRVNKDNKKEYAKIDKNGYITGEWVNEDDIDIMKDFATVGTVETNASGVATVKGLDLGTYYFLEVVAPDGYSINTEPKECEITKDASGDKIVVYGSTYMNDTKLASLPSTGGIGTTIFTIGGCAIMIAAAALYFVNRRKSEEN